MKEEKVGMTLVTWCPEVKKGGSNRQLGLVNRLSSTMARSTEVGKG